MGMKKMMVCLVCAAICALAIAPIVSAEKMENTQMPDAEAAAGTEDYAGDSGTETGKGTASPAPSDTPAASGEPEAKHTSEPADTMNPDVQARTAEPKSANRRAAENPATPTPEGVSGISEEAETGIRLYADGNDVTGGAVILEWADPSAKAPSVRIVVRDADGTKVSPVFTSSNSAVLSVEESGEASAAGFGIATISATVNGETVSCSFTVGETVERMIIIGEDSVLSGHSVKLRAFDQNGNRLSAVWQSSDESLASVDADGVMTAQRNAGGNMVEITAVAGEGSSVYAVKEIRID